MAAEVSADLNVINDEDVLRRMFTGRLLALVGQLGCRSVLLGPVNRKHLSVIGAAFFIKV
ncbi:hypothetical protein J6590_043246 [Homalodisca vitripennis]|nr:hypothetical protein J6590_043246 [Homalodisca vitripennis]